MPYYRWSLRGARPKPGYPKELKSLGDQLRARRLDLALSQTEASGRLGVDPSTIRNWENGRTEIEVRFYPALFEFLGSIPLREPMTLGEAICRKRMVRGWSRKLLASAAGVDEATVNRIEKGHAHTQRSLTAVQGALKKLAEIHGSTSKS